MPQRPRNSSSVQMADQAPCPLWRHQSGDAQQVENLNGVDGHNFAVASPGSIPSRIFHPKDLVHSTTHLRGALPESLDQPQACPVSGSSSKMSASVS